jgi:hypothetical protein
MGNFFAAGKSVFNLDRVIQADFHDDGTAKLYLSDGRTVELAADDAGDLEERLIPAVQE